MDSHLILQPTNALAESLSKPPERLAVALAILQQGTREISPLELPLWQRALSCYHPEDIETAIEEFMQTANREQARGMVLGDLLTLVRRNAEKRWAHGEELQRQAERTRWKQEFEQQSQEDRAWIIAEWARLREQVAVAANTRRMHALPPDWAEREQAEQERKERFRREFAERMQAASLLVVAPEEEQAMIRHAVEAHQLTHAPDCLCRKLPVVANNHPIRKDCAS